MICFSTVSDSLPKVSETEALPSEGPGSRGQVLDSNRSEITVADVGSEAEDRWQPRDGTSRLQTNVSDEPEVSSVPVPRAHLTQRFRELAKAWRADCQFSSSVTEMAMHPAYQQIIGMGREAIRPVLEELESQPDHWFWALYAITGEDPVPSESKGDLREMTELWLQWGRERQYI